MSLKSRAALAAMIGFLVFSLGCGDTFRPIAIPIVQNGGQPQGLREVVVLSTGGPLAGSPEGQTTHVNVSGDTNVGQVVVGRDPVHVALTNNGSITVVVNRGENSLSIYNTLSPTTAQPPFFISLAANAAPTFAYSNINGVVYVTEPGATPPSVAVVTTSSTPTAVTAEIPVGNDPEGLIGMPDGTKLFVANKADSTVSVIDQGTNTVLGAAINVGATPSYLTINSAGTFVFSVNTGGNSVSVIDTTALTAVNVPVGATPNYAYFDGVNNKLWVTNSTGNSVSVINADPNSPGFRTVVATIPLTVSCPTPNPVSITVLADGSRAYVADSGCAAVSVISALSNSVTKTMAVGNKPVSIVSSPDSSKVYTANNQSANISVIRTSDDTVVTTLAAPAGTQPIYAVISPF